MNSAASPIREFTALDDEMAGYERTSGTLELTISVDEASSEGSSRTPIPGYYIIIPVIVIGHSITDLPS